MPGEPQVREAGWFITGTDRDPIYHLFVRLWERMDGSGWRLDVRECRGPHQATRVYETEDDARFVLQAIYQLAEKAPPLATREPDRLEKGRWRITTHDPI